MNCARTSLQSDCLPPPLAIWSGVCASEALHDFLLRRQQICPASIKSPGCFCWCSALDVSLTAICSPATERSGRNVHPSPLHIATSPSPPPRTGGIEIMLDGKRLPKHHGSGGEVLPRSSETSPRRNSSLKPMNPPTLAVFLRHGLR